MAVDVQRHTRRRLADDHAHRDGRDHRFRSPAALQQQVMAAQDDAVALATAQVVHGSGQPALGLVLPGGSIQRQFPAEESVMHVGQFQRHHPQAHPPPPGLPQQRVQPAVEVGFQVGRLREAGPALVLRHVVVAHLHGERADGVILLSQAGAEGVRHAAQRGLRKVLVGDIGGERLLLAVGLGWGTLRDNGPFINAPGELPQQLSLPPGDEFEQLHRRAGQLADMGKPSRVELLAQLGTNAGEPLVAQRGEKVCLPPGGHFLERRRLAQLRGHGAHQLVAPDALADDEFQLLLDGPADGLRHLGRRLAHGGQVEVALVNRGLLHVGGEVVRVAEHPVRELLVTLEVAGQQDELGTEPAGLHGGHGRVDAEPPGLVAGAGNDAALLTPNGHRLAAQLRVGRLLDGGEEGIRVEMNDDAHGDQCGGGERTRAVPRLTPGRDG